MEQSLRTTLDQHATGPTPVAFDPGAYCARIGYTGSREVSPGTLHRLHLAHTHTVPFENVDIHSGRPLSLGASGPILCVNPANPYHWMATTDKAVERIEETDSPKGREAALEPIVEGDRV